MESAAILSRHFEVKYMTITPRESPDMMPEKNLEQGAWLGSRDPVNFGH